MRRRFMDEMYQSVPRAMRLIKNAAYLEMMAALALRCEESIMDDSVMETGHHSGFGK